MGGLDANTPDNSLAAEAIAGTRFVLTRVGSTGSTNADLLASAADGAPDGTVLLADHQRAGRGRRDRTWEAPPGSSILLSVLLRPTIESERVGVLTAAVGLAARSACLGLAGVEVGLKWPNDVVVSCPDGDRKLGGILAESRISGGMPEAIVVGLGLNVDWPDPVPPELDGIAVALNHLTGGGVPGRLELVRALLIDLEPRLRTVEAGGDQAIWGAWRAASVTLGRRVRVETGESHIHGLARDVTTAGRLQVELDSGEVVDVSVGDVVHLRAED